LLENESRGLQLSSKEHKCKSCFNNRKREEEEVKQVKKIKSFLENVIMSNSVQMKLSFKNTIISYIKYDIIIILIKYIFR
jgi:hypothetical protein